MNATETPTYGSRAGFYFDRVNELTAEGLSKSKAFEQVAQEQDLKPSTVQVSYYRHARGRAKGKVEKVEKPQESAPDSMVEAIDALNEAIAELQRRAQALTYAAAAVEQDAREKAERASTEAITRLREAMKTLA